MADTVTSETTVSMTMEFGDGTEKSLTQNNPITNQSELINKINALGQNIAENNIILSKNKANFSRIKAAKISQKQTDKLDLTL